MPRNLSCKQPRAKAGNAKFLELVPRGSSISLNEMLRRFDERKARTTEAAIKIADILQANGIPRNSAAIMMRLCPTTLLYWTARYRNAGFIGLLKKPMGPGAKRRTSKR